jgi:hypothetical protein
MKVNLIKHALVGGILFRAGRYDLEALPASIQTDEELVQVSAQQVRGDLDVDDKKEDLIRRRRARIQERIEAHKRRRNHRP